MTDRGSFAYMCAGLSECSAVGVVRLVSCEIGGGVVRQTLIRVHVCWTTLTE
jgi:hypothetical protein